MKTIINFIFLAILLSGIPLCAEEIKVGYFLYPPFMEAGESKSKPTGLMIDHYENVISKKMGVTIKWFGPYPIPRAIYMLETHEIDIIPVMSKTSDREKIMAFPKVPLFYAKPVVCFKIDSTQKTIGTWDVLNGKRLGINYGSAFHKQLSESQPQLIFSKIRLKTTPVKYALELVLNDELDAYVHPQKIVVKILMKRWNMENKIKILDSPIPERDIYTAISLKRPDLFKKWKTHSNEIVFQPR